MKSAFNFYVKLFIFFTILNRITEKHTVEIFPLVPDTRGRQRERPRNGAAERMLSFHIPLRKCSKVSYRDDVVKSLKYWLKY